MATAALDDADTGRTRTGGARRTPAARNDGARGDPDARSVTRTCGSAIPNNGSFTPRERTDTQGQPARA